MPTSQEIIDFLKGKDPVKTHQAVPPAIAPAELKGHSQYNHRPELVQTGDGRKGRTVEFPNNDPIRPIQEEDRRKNTRRAQRRASGIFWALFATRQDQQQKLAERKAQDKQKTEDEIAAAKQAEEALARAKREQVIATRNAIGRSGILSLIERITKL